VAHRDKKMHNHALGPHYVRRPINHANLTGRPEPNPVQGGSRATADRPRDIGGPLHTLRLLALILTPLGLIGTVSYLITLRPGPLLISIAITATGYGLLRITNAVLGRRPAHSHDTEDSSRDDL
jgi:hypothetical protein